VTVSRATFVGVTPAHTSEIATGNSDRLVRLVNDILELERIGSVQAEWIMD